MKLKTILSTSLLAAMAIGVTSCEDMLKVDSRTVLYDDQNTLDHATDTVYSVMGIISQMQKIADRTVIMNEVRGDLVAVTDHATDDLLEVYNWTKADMSAGNVYDRPVDYYSIINNCNFFLANADTAYIRNHKNVFLKEYITVLSFRAWTYLQMAQVYGNVIYIDEPILSGDMAKTEGKTFVRINELAELLLQDFDDSYLDYDTPDYGSLAGETNGDGSTSMSHTSTNLFIPVRLILGDLNLWAGHYEEAAKYYHDYLAGGTRRHATTTASILWFGNDFLTVPGGNDTYSAAQFGSNSTPICYIPMESDEYNGVTSDLPNIFNSTEDNDNWYQLTRSQALTGLSGGQRYCYHEFRNTGNTFQQPIYMNDEIKSGLENMLYRGDLRLQSIIKTTKLNADEQEVANLNDTKQTIAKIDAERIPIYRDDVVYLRLAEAMNRAGFPKSAFAILKYGLCYDIINRTSVTNQYETKPMFLDDEKADAVARGLSELFEFDESGFQQAVMEGAQKEQTVDGIRYQRFDPQYVTMNSNYNTIGIHARGCGDAAFDTLYVIPDNLLEADLTQPANMQKLQRFVEEKIADEMALETCFEGYRFGDLMRISMHRAEDTDLGASGYSDNDFLASRVASRENLKPEDVEAIYAGTKSYTDFVDPDLYEKLLGDDPYGYNSKWFLKLIK